MKTHAVISILALVISGCVFAPTEQTGPEELPTPPLPFTSISNTMFNFELAHEEQNGELYLECLAADYQFFLEAADADEIGVEFYSRQEDAAQMESIFSSADLIDIRFDAIPHAVENQCWQAGDCVSSVVDDWAEINYTVQVELEWIEGLERACGTAVFSFDLTDPSDIRIVRIVDFTGQNSC